MIVTFLYIGVVGFILAICLFLFFAEKNTTPHISPPESVNAVLTIHHPEQVTRAHLQTLLIRKNMPFIDQVFVLTAENVEIPGAVVSPGSLFDNDLPGDEFLCLYDNIFPTRKIKYTDFYTDISCRRRCFGLIDPTLILLDEKKLFRCTPVVPVSRAELHFYTSMNHFLLESDVVVTQWMCSDVYVLQDGQIESGDSLFVKVISDSTDWDDKVHQFIESLNT